MGETRTSNPARHLLARTRTRSSGRVFERLRHVLWAGLISLALFAITFFDPIDQFLWLTQSRIADRSPSGDVIFVSSDEVLNDPDDPKARFKVASALNELDRRGVGKVFLDVTFPKSSDAQADEELAKAIAHLGPRITLVDRVISGPGLTKERRATANSIAGGADRVVSDQTDRNWFGFAWELHHAYKYDGAAFRGFGSAIAGAQGDANSPYIVDYGFAHLKIPILAMQSLNREASGLSSSPIDVTSKVVVLGHSNRVAGTQQPIPMMINAPASFVDIYAGETLKAGHTQYLSGAVVLCAFASLLSAALILGITRKRRWISYVILALLAPILLFVTAKLGIRVDLSYTVGFLIIFAGFRSRSRWKRRVEMVNGETGLPKLRALEARLLRDNVCSGHIVIARIQNYERVLKTLKAEDKGKYVLKFVDRLRAADPKLAIYSEGHHLGWHVANDVTDDVIEHLEGLRAIFAAPIQVGGYSVDVGITFGVATVEGDPAARLAAAVAAAEETSEAHNPITISETGSQSDLLWDISLRARIDEAMEVGEIYCVYQPKIDLVSKSVAGVEALVRWHDPARGFISPVHFIQQCEKAGRMEHLTRFVLQTACSAGRLLHFRGHKITMSVNISATLLGDMRIAGLVRNALQAADFDPQYLVLEITETSRISDYSIAASILDEIKTIGVKVSMDDFGIGSASYEAFYELPFDEIKIDRLFVSNMAKDPKARAIVASIASMGREARINVVAEGLENPQDIHLLEVIGCQQVQGYAYSRPVSLSNLLELKDAMDSQASANAV